MSGSLGNISAHSTRRATRARGLALWTNAKKSSITRETPSLGSFHRWRLPAIYCRRGRARASDRLTRLGGRLALLDREEVPGILKHLVWAGDGIRESEPLRRRQLKTLASVRLRRRREKRLLQLAYPVTLSD